MFRNDAAFVLCVECPTIKSPPLAGGAWGGGEIKVSVEVEIAGVFRSYFDGEKTVAAEGKSIGEVLEYLSDKYPMTKNMFIDDTGRMQNRFEVYLNGESIYQSGIDTPVNDGDRIDLVYIIHGG